MQIYHDTYCVIDIQQVIACSCLRLIRNYIRFGTKKLELFSTCKKKTPWYIYCHWIVIFKHICILIQTSQTSGSFNNMYWLTWTRPKRHNKRYANYALEQSNTLNLSMKRFMELKVMIPNPKCSVFYLFTSWNSITNKSSLVILKYT